VSKLDEHEDEIRKLISHGFAKAAIARLIQSDRAQLVARRENEEGSAGAVLDKKLA